jgi:hypothetical protein
MTSRVAKFLTLDYPWPWLRQTPGGDGVFGETRFVFDRGCRDYDYLVVFNQIPPELNERIDPRRAVFVAAEPINIKRYDFRFLRQFGTIITNDRDTPHPRRIFSQVGAPWHIGVPTGQLARYGESVSFAQLERLSGPKTKLVSVICSDKDFTPAHRRRLEFVNALRAHFGARLDFFGRGLRDFEDKAQALVPYRYHIALENTDASDAWTEKIADPYLTETFPIYWGCRNLQDYFPADSFARVDMDDHKAAIEAIEEIIGSDRAERSRAALAEAKRRALFDHNIFALLDRTLADLEAHGRNSAGAAVMLVPEPAIVARYSRPPLAARLKEGVRLALGRYPRIFGFVRTCYRMLASVTRARREVRS